MDENGSLCWPLETQVVVYVLLPSGDSSPEMQHKTRSCRERGQGCSSAPVTSSSGLISLTGKS